MCLICIYCSIYCRIYSSLAALCRCLPWIELGEMDTRCCNCCKEEDDEEEEEEVAFAVLEWGQPSVLGAERGRELVVQ